jgi:Protein of unknown function (DUF3105)
MSKESARASAEHRRAVVAAAKKAEQRRRLVSRVIVAVVAAVVVAGIVAIVLVVTHPSATSAGARNGTTRPNAAGQIIPAAASGPTTVEQPVTPVKDTSGIAGVLAWDTTGWPGDGTAHAGALEHDHVTGPVTYSVLPPVGGPHNAIWMNAGVYTKPVPTERAVHNLEHGAVWITYDPKLPAAEVAQLTEFVTKQSLIAEPASEIGISGDSNRYMDLSPWASNSLPSPIVMSAWGHQLRVTSPTDPRLQQFVDTFRHKQKYSPEFGAAVDGIPVQTGGRPALDGGTQPNPAGSAG